MKILSWIVVLKNKMSNLNIGFELHLTSQGLPLLFSKFTLGKVHKGLWVLYGNEICLQHTLCLLYYLLIKSSQFCLVIIYLSFSWSTNYLFYLIFFLVIIILYSSASKNIFLFDRYIFALKSLFDLSIIIWWFIELYVWVTIEG